MPLSQMIGEQIKALRKKRRLTQQQLADSIGAHRITVVQIENGQWDSSILTLEKIAHVLEGAWTIKLIAGSGSIF